MYWPKKYTRIPFKDRGRDFGGADCWGLVRLVYRHELNVELPEYGEISSEDLKRVSDEMSAGAAGGNWQHVEKPAEFDVVLMRFYGHRMIGHVGVVTPDNKVLHMESGANVLLVPLSHAMIKTRLRGFGRFIR